MSSTSLTLRSGGGSRDPGSKKSGGSGSGMYQNVIQENVFSKNDEEQEEAATVPLPKKPVAGAGAFSTTINIVKNVVGAGLLSMPLTLYNGTPAVAYTWLVFQGVLNCFSFWALGVISEGTCNSYGQLWEKTIGKKTRLIPDLALLINGIITCMGYLVVIADYVPKAIPSAFGEGGAFKAVSTPKGDMTGGATERLYPVLFAGYLIIFPIALFSKLDFLKWPSFVGVAMTLYAVIYVIFDFAKRGYFSKEVPRENGEDTNDFSEKYATAWEDQREDGRGKFQFSMMLTLMSIYSSSYACHYNSPKFYKELGPTRSPMQYFIISLVSFIIIVIIFITFVACGYGRFGGLVDGNFLVSYTLVPSDFKDDIAVKVAWLGMAFSVMTSYPLISNSARAALFEVFFPYTADKSATWVYVTVTFVYVTISVIMGWISPNVALLNSIKGATTTVLLCSIFPALMLLFKVWQDEAALKGDIEQPPQSAGAAENADQEPLLSNRSFPPQSQRSSRRSNADSAKSGEATQPSADEEEQKTTFNTVAKGGRRFKIIAYILLAFTGLMSLTGIVMVALEQAEVIGREPPMEKKCAKNWKVKNEKKEDNTSYVLKENPQQAAFLVALMEDQKMQTSGVWGEVCKWKDSKIKQIKANYDYLLPLLDPAHPSGGGNAAAGGVVFDEACKKVKTN